jgi:cell division protein FtsQ
MLGKLKRKKTELKIKQNRIRRRFTDMSGDFLGAAGLLFAAAVLCSLFIYAYAYLLSSPYFHVREVSVRGLKELTEKEVLTAADIQSAQNLLAVNTEVVTHRIRGNNWVEDVYIGRELPGRLVMEVRERTPLALVKMSGEFYLMDVKGFIFKRLGKNDEVDFPVITGISGKNQIQTPLLLNTLNLLKTLSESSEYPYLGMVSEVNVDDLFGLSLISDNGLYVKLGLEGFEEKLKKLKPVLDDLESRGLKAGYLCVDLSDHSKATVKRRNVPEKTEQTGKGRHYQI